MNDESISGTTCALCNIVMVIFLLIIMIHIININCNVDKMKNDVINTTETISINGKEYKQVKEENTETGKKVYYIIKQEKSDVKNINIE